MRGLRSQVMILGALFPIVTVALVTATLVSTILAANVEAFLAVGVMIPALVIGGQVWRLLTWTFFEMSPLGLIFACFAFLFFGRELVHHWGPTRFLRVCLGIVVGAAVVTCLVAFLWPRVMGSAYASAWPLGEALIVAYAMLFPSRTILFSLIIPVAGRQLLILTVAATLLFGLLVSFVVVIPHFAAQGLMYAYLRGYSPRLLWLRLKARSVRWSPQRRASHLRPVERDDEEPPRWLH
ncbi:MAG TPA: rhomboid family intramembrane serine protease [Vicinamibacteria bacterium]|nr:rhomboid family intramembrane serine protease [Vicinamibacteria bacterium]